MSKELHVITSGKQPMEEVVSIAGNIHPYIDYLHIREKEYSASQLVEMIEELIRIGIPRSKLIVNDRVDVAVAINVAGVQLGYRSISTHLVKKKFPTLYVGASIHSVEEALAREKDGADYLIYGHIFPSASKPGLAPRGIKQLEQLVQSVQTPVIALGGIQFENVIEVLSADVAGVAVMSYIWEAKDPIFQVKKLVEKIKEYDHKVHMR
ncbi:thiazole tautomerase TenI [Cytobacillus spongiae]|uniref:thiazole tautomerase TenI n=1 Tax=Cytobacillus spongiae TaxID=2901381 RepID=UPI001F35E2B3|nr:thiazole tautomerase TenI [Cytobacillus spongiae]UII54251.1 thiazole tautomerase TenI [Cytobacillus spongiae]